MQGTNPPRCESCRLRQGFEDLGSNCSRGIHSRNPKIYREMCQRFPMLPPDDVAQQTWVAFLETQSLQQCCGKMDSFQLRSS